MTKWFFILLCFFTLVQRTFTQPICDCNYGGCGKFQMKHFHKIDGHPSFQNRFLVNDSSCVDIEFPFNFQVAADGTASSEIEITWLFNCCTFGFWPLQLTLLDEDYNEVGNSDPDMYGKFIKTSSTKEIQTFTYQHPKRLPNDGQLEYILPVRVHSGDAQYTFIYVHIKRPPVLMVHGLWSDASAFSPMESYLRSTGNYEDYHLLKADYMSTNASHFATNQFIVEQAVEELIETCAYHDQSVGKVNVVCHSMGGLLTRMYVQNPAFANRKDIDKIITCNTPHAGSQMANWLLDNSQYGAIASAVLAKAGQNCYGGAVHDLKTGGVPIALINLGTPTANVRVFAINTIINGFPPFVMGTLQRLSSLGLLSGMISYCGNAFIVDIFDNDYHDLIVAKESQNGGLTPNYTFEAQFQQHVGSVANGTVMNKVNDLLNAPYYALNFSNQYNAINNVGYTFNVPCLPLQGERPVDTRTSSSMLDIISPNNFSSFNAGDTMAIQFNASMVDSVLALVRFEADSIIMLGGASTSGGINLPIPKKTYGWNNVLLLGFDSERKVIALDTVMINFTTSATLDSIAVYPNLLNMNIGDTSSIMVTGFYNDSIWRNITLDSSLVFDFSFDHAQRTNLHYIVLDSAINDNLKVKKGTIESNNVLINITGQVFPANCKMVTTTNYTGAGSLSDAVLCALSGDTITFHSSIANDTIDFGNEILQIDKSISIINQNANKIHIKSTSNFALITYGGEDIYLENLSFITDNVDVENFCIHNFGNLTLKDIEAKSLSSIKAKIVNNESGSVEFLGSNQIR